MALKVGFLGAGKMGGFMIEALLNKGYDVTVWNRSKSKIYLNLVEKGAKEAVSPQDALINKDYVCCMLFDAKTLIDVVEPACKLAKNSSASLSKILFNFSTVSPGDSKSMHELFSKYDVQYIENPVLGPPDAARLCKLQMLSGGLPESQWEGLKDFLSCFGLPRFISSEIGQASRYKLILNQMVIGVPLVFYNSVALAEACGLPKELLIDTIKDTPLYCGYMGYKFSHINGDEVHGSVENLAKDAKLINELAEEVGVRGDLMKAMYNLQSDAASSYPGQDFSNVYKIVSNGTSKVESTSEKSETKYEPKFC